MRARFTLLLAMLLFVTSMEGSTFAAKIIYVDCDANGLNDGSSWKDAYNYLQDALADANSVEKPIEIRIAQGIYKPDRTSSEPNGTGDQTATFQLIYGVTLKGGYAGTGASDPNERDIIKYKTILSGDLDGNDVEVSDPCDLLTEPTRAENSYHVVTGSSTDATAVVDGFTITGGNANGTDGPPDYLNCGGGIFNGFNYARPTVVNCTFGGNSAEYGGAILGAYSEIVNCVIKHNSARIGGGISACWQSIADCIISHNWAERGGGMGDCECLVTNCTISGNSAISDGGGIWCYEEDLTITSSTISGNSAKDKGGGMYFYFYWLSGQTVSNCTMIGNSALKGGGIYGNDGTKVSNCILWGNTAPTRPHIRGIGSIAYTNVQGGWPSQGNIDADPCFVDPNGLDDVVGTQDDNLRLLPSSPCIDTGDPNYVPEPNEKDLDGNPRLVGPAVDMGAFEAQPVIRLYPNEFTFTAFLNCKDKNPASQKLTIYNAGAGTVNWQISYDCNWLTVHPSSGSSERWSPGVDVTLDVNIASLDMGDYYCNLIVRDPNAQNSPQIANVKLDFYVDCFPQWHPMYPDWEMYLEPNCWCPPPCGSGYQCDGDADGKTQVVGYRVYTNDLAILVNNWKKKITDPNLNPCADFDHRGQVAGYRVYTNDLTILSNNWKKKAGDLPGKCPRPK